MSDVSIGENGERTKAGDVLEEEDSVLEQEEQPGPSLRAAVRRFFDNLQPKVAVAKPDLKKDRTQSFLVLIGGIIGAVLLFVGVFSTPPAPFGKRQGTPVRPTLERPEDAPITPITSVTPLLNAQPQDDGYGRDRIDARDVTNTSRLDVSENDRQNPRGFMPQERTRISAAREGQIVYRRATMTVGIPAVAVQTPATEPNSFVPTTFGSPKVQTRSSSTTGLERTSSIVFVRTSVPITADAIPPAPHTFDSSTAQLLPPGSRLIAHLESAVTSALKVPVVAAIEYNYERDGMILIPAGTKVIGDLQQASINGYVAISFHTLQMPDGSIEKIEALAMDLQNGPLKGKVTGTNKGRKFITRTISGVGTIAAYVVGGGGSSIGQGINGETLLRDRLASNIAAAGEQELTNAAYSQNIVITVPAQTRLYIVLQKAAIEPSTNGAGPGMIHSTRTELPTVQELRELMDLKREINRIYESAASSSDPSKP